MNDLLIVDDELSVRQVLEGLMRRAGLPCRSAATPRRVLQAVAADWPGAILLDLNLEKDGDGWRLWDQLAQQANGRPLRVLIYAAALDRRDREAAQQRGAVAILSKTTPAKQLVETVRQALNEGG